MILCARVGKHTDELAIELVASTEGKTDCKEWHTDGWEGYGRVLPDEVEHYISKGLTQRKRANQWDCSLLKRSRWHRRQNKFGKVWERSRDRCKARPGLL